MSGSNFPQYDEIYKTYGSKVYAANPETYRGTLVTLKLLRRALGGKDYPFPADNRTGRCRKGNAASIQ